MYYDNKYNIVGQSTYERDSLISEMHAIEMEGGMINFCESGGT
jgi:hypothetical protein